TAGLASVLFGLIEAQTYGWVFLNQEFSVDGFSWPTSYPISLPLLSIPVGIILLAIFTIYEIRRARKGRVPLFDFSLLKYKGFRYGLFTVTIVAMSEFGAVFIISIFLQTVKGLHAIDAGLTFLPMAISAFGIAVIGASLVAQVSAVGQADLASSTVNFGSMASVLKAALNSGLSGGIDKSFIAAFGMNWPAARDIIFDALTQGTRWAAFTAGIFVSL